MFNPFKDLFGSSKGKKSRPKPKPKARPKGKAPGAPGASGGDWLSRLLGRAPAQPAGRGKMSGRPGRMLDPRGRLPDRSGIPGRSARRGEFPPYDPYDPDAPPAPSGLSLDRRLDILGVVLVFVGLISGLSLLTANTNPVLEAWLRMLQSLAGWGMFGLPLGLMGVGLWLVLRKFGDKLPKVDPERLLGIVLLYLALLTTLHFVAAPVKEDIFAVVSAGRGGGIIGAAVLWGFFQVLGAVGSVFALVAWWIIAIMFTLGRSVPEIVLLLLGWVEKWRGRRGAVSQPPLPLPTATKVPAKEGKPAPADRPEKKAPAKAAPAEAAASAKPTAAAPAAKTAPAYDQPIILGNEAVRLPWELPKADDVLEMGAEGGADDDLDRQRARVIENTLTSFGAPVKVVEVNRGPTITQFGVEPEFLELRGGKRTKVKVSKIAALADDLALALSAQTIRIEAPVPGKGYVGIEVPNPETTLVALRDVMEAENFGKLKSSLRLGLGQDVSGTAIAADLVKMPHLLIAGTTGSGKSVCVNAIIVALLLQNTPDDLRLLMVDPKRVELTGYNGIPHLLAPVVVDLERVVSSLQWVTREMDERYHRLAKAGVRNIEDFNRRLAPTDPKMPYLVVIIDELADLMMLAPDETERTITRLAQLSRATGIHLIIATQRPSVDVVTGLIKANFPARVAFAVASSIDSRVILDQPGAERLLGRGDMLFQSPDAATPLRMQGVFISDHEVQRLVHYWREARLARMPTPPLNEGGELDDTPPLPLPVARSVPPLPTTSTPAVQPPLPALEPLLDFEPTPEGSSDELLEEAVQAVRQMKKASISMLQRHLRIGYTRAARLMDELEERGIVGPAESGAKQREVIDFGAPEYDPTRTEK